MDRPTTIALTGFVVAMALFVTASIYTYKNNKAQNETSDWISHSNEVRFRTEQLLDHLYEAQANQRGFLLSGDSLFLPLYYDAIDSFNFNLLRLQNLTRDNVAQQNNLKVLKPLLIKRLAHLNENIQRSENPGFRQKMGKTLFAEDRSLMDDLLIKFDNIHRLEKTLLNERIKENEIRIRAFNRTYFILVSLVAIILVVMFYLIYYNLRKNKEISENLRHSLKKIQGYKFALDESSIVTITDEHGIITHVNDKFCQISNYSRKELIGKEPRIINSGYHPKEYFQSFWQTIMSGEVWRGEICNKAKDGTIYWVLETVIPFLNEYNQPYQYMAISFDITDRKKGELNLKKLNKELESFSYSISHDLRAPLRSINGYAMMLQEDYMDKLDEEGIRLLGVVIKNATRMGQLIDDLLDFSRLNRQSLGKSRIDMDQFVRQIAEELLVDEDRQRVELTINSLGSVKADYKMLRQVIINLLSNALKYSNRKEKSIIEIGSMNGQANAKTIYFKDNGVGFDMAYEHKLFKVFQRLHKSSEFEGTGVGLALCKRIIERHDGKIWVEAEPDCGATFYFNLPS